MGEKDAFAYGKPFYTGRLPVVKYNKSENGMHNDQVMIVGNFVWEGIKNVTLPSVVEFGGVVPGVGCVS